MSSRAPLRLLATLVLLSTAQAAPPLQLLVPFVPEPLPQTQRPNPLPQGMVSSFPGGGNRANERCNPSLEGLRLPAKPVLNSLAPEVSRKIQALYDADQNGRQTATYSPTRDLQNRKALLPLLSKASTHMDLSNAAMIFQHGNCVAHYQLTYTLALKGGSLWLAAASLDRALMHLGAPQKYGTQYITRNRTGNCWALWMVDPRTTNAERRAMNVPPLEEALDRVKEMSDATCN